MEQKKVAFIIPARGGSKGIKNKNITLFNGDPLISWTINAAISTGLGPVFVSTDDKQIEKVAIDSGAIVHERPKELAQDHSQSEDAILELINKMPEYKNIYEDTIFLQCTSPFITTKDILEAYETFKKGKFKSLVFAKKTHQYFGETDKNNCFVPFHKKRLLRQEMNKFVCEVGAYIFNTKEFVKTKYRIIEPCGTHIINRELPPEIDTVADWCINEDDFYYWRGESL